MTEPSSASTELSPTRELAKLRFDNRFVAELPADPEPFNERRQVLGACYSRVTPEPVKEPKLVAYSPEVAELLELPKTVMHSREMARVMGGNAVIQGMVPYAACYGGHQFGNWAGQLGDGRAISLGQLKLSSGDSWELQLKGAGPTPYSRTADGRAVLRSSIREFLCSEAMHHLGVPTTRALSLVTTGEAVVRDMLYDGNPKPEPGAVVCRVAPNFIRFGNFEMFAARNDEATLKQLTDYTIEHYFPQFSQLAAPKRYLRLFEEVCRRTALMVTHWMRVGFVHGVMNTDNMSVLGLTIDYGPYGWLENYDPRWTPNTTDAFGRRYRYSRQPNIAGWNLARFAEALLPLVKHPAPMQEILDDYQRYLQAQHLEMAGAKLGLTSEQAIPFPVEQLYQELTEVMEHVEADMTLFFRRLADFNLKEHMKATASERVAWFSETVYVDTFSDEQEQRLGDWLSRYLENLKHQSIPDDERRRQMNVVNPKYVLRNYLAQLAIDQAEQEDFELVHELLDVLRQPYTEQPGKEKFAAKRPEWARHRAGCSMLSCSS